MPREYLRGKLFRFAQSPLARKQPLPLNGRRGPRWAVPLVMESRVPKGADKVGIWDENGVFAFSVPWRRKHANYECSLAGPGGMAVVHSLFSSVYTEVRMNSFQTLREIPWNRRFFGTRQPQHMTNDRDAVTNRISSEAPGGHRCLGYGSDR